MKIVSLYVIMKGFGSGDVREYTYSGYFIRLLKSNEFKLNLITENLDQFLSNILSIMYY